MSSILREREVALREAEHQAYLSQLRALHKVAIAAWLAYIAFDYISTLVPGAVAFRWMVAIRVSAASLIALALFVLNRFRLSRAALHIADLLLLIQPTLVIAYFCWRDGLGTPFVAGYAFAITCRGGLIRDVWWRTLLHLSPPLIGVALSPFIAKGFPGVLRPGGVPLTDLIAFTHMSFVVISSALFATIGAHVAWSLGRGAFVGRSIGKYRLQNCIGSGGMGEVWSARDTSLKRDVAVKMMMFGDTPRSVQARARFDREIRALMAIDHPHAVRILDFGTAGEHINYLVMDLLPGSDLAQLVRQQGVVAPLRALALLEQAARAAEHAHNLGIVHRDIKPSNIFISDVGDDIGHVRLLDFGIAKLDEEVDEGITATGAFVGTVHFAAPELALGEDATIASDIYALGAVAYFALTGSTPFVGLTRGGVLDALASGDVLDLRTKAPHLDQEIVSLVRKAMHPIPGERFPSAKAFAEAIRSVLWPMRAKEKVHLPVPEVLAPCDDSASAMISTVDGPRLAVLRARSSL